MSLLFQNRNLKEEHGAEVKIDVVTPKNSSHDINSLLLASNHDHLSFSKKYLWKVE